MWQPIFIPNIIQYYWCFSTCVIVFNSTEAVVTTLNTSAGSYMDPTLFIIMGALALMFIGMCVVLRIFAK